MMLDTDGDGEIDYQEFARWFGSGPPPPPMLPEVKMRIEAQVCASPACLLAFCRLLAKSQLV